MNTSSHSFRVTKLRAGDLAYKRGDFRSAMANYDGVLQDSEKVDDQNLESIALIKKAICMSAVNRLAEAEKLIFKVITFEAHNVLDANEAALLHHEYSVLLFRLERFREGLREEEKALDLLRRAEYLDKELLVLVLKQLAVYRTRDKDFKAADSFLEDAITVALQSPEIGKDSLLHGQLLITQALAKIDQRKFADAKEISERAILLIQIHEGLDNPKVAELFRIFAKHFNDAGQSSEAEEFRIRASEIESSIKNKARRW
jgi:hypothetical protein